MSFSTRNDYGFAFCTHTDKSFSLSYLHGSYVEGTSDLERTFDAVRLHNQVLHRNIVQSTGL
jgi:hypothetical protein